jgi:hypothetical protein
MGLKKAIKTLVIVSVCWPGFKPDTSNKQLRYLTAGASLLGVFLSIYQLGQCQPILRFIPKVFFIIV